MNKKISLICAATLLSASLTVPALADNTVVPSEDMVTATANGGGRTTGNNGNGNMGPTGTDNNGDFGTTGNYRTNNYRAQAADNDGVDWGWLGLLGLLGLAGMRRKSTER